MCLKFECVVTSSSRCWQVVTKLLKKIFDSKLNSATCPLLAYVCGKEVSRQHQFETMSKTYRLLTHHSKCNTKLQSTLRRATRINLWDSCGEVTLPLATYFIQFNRSFFVFIYAFTFQYASYFSQIIITITIIIMVKLSLCLTKHHVMKAYWGVAV
jgi:hypothetical protein